MTFVLAQRVARGRSYDRITCWVDSVNKSPVCETHCYMIITKGQGFRETQKRLGMHRHKVSNQTCCMSANIATSFRNEDNTGFRISVHIKYGDLSGVPLAWRDFLQKLLLSFLLFGMIFGWSSPACLPKGTAGVSQSHVHNLAKNVLTEAENLHSPKFLIEEITSESTLDWISVSYSSFIWAIRNPHSDIKSPFL